MNRNALLGGSYLGRRGHAPLFGGLFAAPGRMTSNTAARIEERKAGEILEGIRTALATLGDRAEPRRPSVIVVARQVPDGMIVEAGEVCFMTCSTEGLDRILEFAIAADPYVRDAPRASPSLLGVPVVILEDIARSEDPKRRKLAGYYAAAIEGARRAYGPFPV